MTTAQLLADLIKAGGRTTTTLEGLTISRYSSGVLNVIDRDTEDLTREQIDRFRGWLAEAGYVEKESWVATQGASWLSPGLFAGVSMLIAPAEGGR